MTMQLFKTKQRKEYKFYMNMHIINKCALCSNKVTKAHTCLNTSTEGIGFNLVCDEEKNQKYMINMNSKSDKCFKRIKNQI